MQKTILVAGDPTVDWMLTVHGEQPDANTPVIFSYEAPSKVAVAAGAGGAALLHKLTGSIVEKGGMAIAVRGIEVPQEAIDLPHYNGIARTYTVWQRFPKVTGSQDHAWRIARFMGKDTLPAHGSVTQPEPGGVITTLLIEDTNKGFRETGIRGIEHANGGTGPEHIVLRMTNPLVEGEFWQSITEQFGDRVTLCIAVADLRKQHAAIGQALSWERTASEITAAIRSRPEFRRVARTVINAGYGGAVIVERDGANTLIYDPFHQEGDWERQRPGFPFGIGLIAAAATAVEATARPDKPDWTGAIANALCASRVGVETGQILEEVDGRTYLRFPFEAVSRSLLMGDPAGTFHVAPIPDETNWRLFDHAFTSGYRVAASEITLDGDREACRSLPVERMGAWASVDRTEIESMRSLRNIVGEYLSQPRRGRPLNLAVFGPPGSGKSFAIKQMAKQWTGGAIKLSTLEFNVSQFSSLTDLPAALQRVRDCAVEESIPLVFWDEFDTQFGGHELGWLAQFLAPMQDGAFLENGTARPIGPAIFIFAGGTHATMESFKQRAVEIPGAKATDFLSRLRGFVDILGPNPCDERDETFLLRRALLLRAVLRGKAPRFFTGERLNIDPGVLRAFLDVERYLHGSRSMESIVDMSSIAGALRYERSALPAAHQLGLHVDPASSLNLVSQEADV